MVATGTCPRRGHRRRGPRRRWLPVLRHSPAPCRPSTRPRRRAAQATIWDGTGRPRGFPLPAMEMVPCPSARCAAFADGRLEMSLDAYRREPSHADRRRPRPDVCARRRGGPTSRRRTPQRERGEGRDLEANVSPDGCPRSHGAGGSSTWRHRSAREERREHATVVGPFRRLLQPRSRQLRTVGVGEAPRGGDGDPSRDQESSSRGQMEGGIVDYPAGSARRPGDPDQPRHGQMRNDGTADGGPRRNLPSDHIRPTATKKRIDHRKHDVRPFRDPKEQCPPVKPDFTLRLEEESLTKEVA